MSYFSSRSNVLSGSEDLSLLSSRQVPSKEESDSDHLVDLKHSLKDLSSFALYERIEQQHLKHSDLFKLYCQSIAPNSIPPLTVSNTSNSSSSTTPLLVHSRSENSLLSNSSSNNVYKSLLEMVNSNDILFSIVIWIATQIPLSQRYSKSLKKNFDKVFTCKTFISLLTSQLHKQQMLYFPSINYAGIKSHMDIVEKINSLYKIFNPSNQLQQQSVLSYNDESFSFKQAWSKVQAETFGQFLLEIGIIQNIKPEKKRKFAERSHYYMFSIETILYYAELFFEDKVSSQQQQNVLNQFRNPSFNDSGFTAFSQNVNSPFLSNISAASMHLVSIGQNLQKSSLLNLIVSQEREFEMIQGHIKKTHEEIAQESNSSGSSLDVTSPRSGESPSQLSDATSSAFSLVFRQDHQRSKSRDFARTAPKVNHHRMSTNLSLNTDQIWNQPKDLELKEVIRGKNQHLFETPTLSPRSRFYEENGIKAKIQSVQQALNNPTINEEFTQYCTKDHSEENILFWKEIQSYKRIQSPSERKLKFKELVSQFVSSNSPHSTPVNLESKIVTSFLTLAEENEENISFFSTEVFNELEWLVVNNLKDTFTRFNDERNKEIDSQIDELQQNLRLEAIKKEQHSKSFLSQVASAIGRKKTNSTSTNNAHNNLIIPPPKLQVAVEENKKEMERVPAHEYCTLEAVLCSPNARKQFRIFCKKEHAEEYILFLDSVDEYKTFTGKLDRCKKAHEIFNIFIELPTSGSFLHEEDVRTLDCTKDERETIRKKLDSGELEMFDAVVISIQNQMLDVYNRFATAQMEWKAKKMLM
ncbi:RGS domain-containing protein [Naegleria gruberi]|uniref:RGS domain-containing protein n=1 Tax=Naegleria gruberi TaxID=5762 RepID=D2W1P5_NAEGR|nr:RGS domain-containing protein [Naegleria gruberi]EFC36957.1 RGS domain-containing protein [Naegleria gruberi]|eukprot:XP_002669701.1 RGS domain-containing protein [Naegleria gruberi strain NEG-M]